MAKKEKTGLRNIKKPSLKGKGSSLAFALLALVLTILVFGGLLLVQNAFTEKIVYKQVVVAKVDIPEKEIITSENAATYFEVKQMNVLDTNNGAMESLDQIIGQKTKVPFYAGEIVAVKDFENISSYTRDFKNPVEVSIEIGSVADSDGGKIRAGDVVNLTMMFTKEQLGLSNSFSFGGNGLSALPYEVNAPEETDDIVIDDIGEESDLQVDAEPEDPVVLTTEDVVEANTTGSDYVFDYYAKYIVEDLYVTKALDSAGMEIAPSDKDSVASILVFVIEKDEEAAINNALANCANIRVSRIVKEDKSAGTGAVEPTSVNVDEQNTEVVPNDEVIDEPTDEAQDDAALTEVTDGVEESDEEVVDDSLEE